MHTKDRTGLIGEKKAEEHLCGAGHEVLARRWRCAAGELDLVTRCGDTLVGVEVKTRRGLNYGHPFEAVTRSKLWRLHRLLAAYAKQNGLSGLHRRVDLVAVVLEPAPFGDAVALLEHTEDVHQ